jgi:hypothetical protein
MVTSINIIGHFQVQHTSSFHHLHPSCFNLQPFFIVYSHCIFIVPTIELQISWKTIAQSLLQQNKDVDNHENNKNKQG